MFLPFRMKQVCSHRFSLLTVGLVWKVWVETYFWFLAMTGQFGLTAISCWVVPVQGWSQHTRFWLMWLHFSWFYRLLPHPFFPSCSFLGNVFQTLTAGLCDLHRAPQEKAAEAVLSLSKPPTSFFSLFFLFSIQAFILIGLLSSWLSFQSMHVIGNEVIIWDGITWPLFYCTSLFETLFFLLSLLNTQGQSCVLTGLMVQLPPESCWCRCACLRCFAGTLSG